MSREAMPTACDVSRLVVADPRLARDRVHQALLSLRSDRAQGIAVEVCNDLAREQVAGLERSLGEGGVRPLAGVLLGLKDAIDVIGTTTTMGLSALRSRRSPETAYVYQLLEDAGCVLLAKLQMDELALGVTGESPVAPPCPNPWRADVIPGGSSGGSAAAVAAGLCDVALGTDTAGSVRVPAALCGVVGLKPTNGRLSVRGVLPLSWTLDCVGPIARSVGDVAAVFAVLDRRDHRDLFAAVAPRARHNESLSKRIALASGGFFAGASPGVVERLEAVASVLEQAGHSIEQVELKWDVPGGIISTEASTRYGHLLGDPECPSPHVASLLRAGVERAAQDYALSMREARIFAHGMESFFRRFDALLAPTTPIPAPSRRDIQPRHVASRLTSFTAFANVAGVPAITLPAGLSDGLPVGAQIVAGAWNDELVLDLADTVERALGRSPSPPFAGDR